MAKVWEFLRKASMMEFLSIKLQTCSLQTATLILRLFITDIFLKMYQTLAFLQNHILREKVYGGPAS